MIIWNHTKICYFKNWIYCNIKYNFFHYIMYIIRLLYVIKHFWSFEILNSQMYIFWIFKVLRFHMFEIVNVFSVCIVGYLSPHFFTIESTFIIWILWKSFVKMPFFHDRNFHIWKSFTKPKPKIGSNGF